MGLEILILADSIRNHPYVELADVQFYQHIGHRNINNRNIHKPPVLASKEPNNMIIAVMLQNGTLSTLKKVKAYEQLIQELKIELIASPFSIDFNDKMFNSPSEVFSYFKKKDNSPFARFNCSILQRLSVSEFVAAAGCSITGEDIVQNNLLINFVHQDKKRAMALLEKHHIKITNGNADYMSAKADLDIGIGIFDLKAIFEQSGLFMLVEMNAVTRIWLD
jgi:hypothetical protein